MGLSSSEDRMIVAGVVLAWDQRVTVTDGQTESIMANTALCIASYADALYKADVFIRDLFQMIKKIAALRLIGMASPYQILDWYGCRHTCHTASGALG